MASARLIALAAVASALLVLASAIATADAQNSNPASSSARPELGRRPYEIRAWLSFRPGSRLDARGQTNLAKDWRQLVRRFVGAPWNLEIEPGEGPMAGASPLDQLSEESVQKWLPVGDLWNDLVFADKTAMADKYWLIQIEPNRAGYRLSAREFDMATRRLGPQHQRAAPYPEDAARELLELSLSVFSPVAEVIDAKLGAATLRVQAALLTPASPIGRIAAPGATFRPFRVFLNPDGSILRVFDIAYTYLLVDASENDSAKCRVISSYGDPLSKRAGRRMRHVALGVKATGGATELQFMGATGKEGKERQPMAGYRLVARDIDKDIALSVGLTDREGRIAIDSREFPGLRRYQLLAGDVEPLAELKLIAGLDRFSAPIVVQPRVQAMDAHFEINRYVDQLLDLVAERSRLLKTLRSRADAKNWPEVKTLMAERTKFTPVNVWKERVGKLREEAAKRKSSTRAVQGRLVELESLVDRYLSDEEFEAIAEELADAEAQGGAAKKAQVPTGAASAPPGYPTAPAPAPPPATAPASTPAPAPALTPGGSSAPMPMSPPR